jgi:hypothetical protein
VLVLPIFVLLTTIQPWKQQYRGGGGLASSAVLEPVIQRCYGLAVDAAHMGRMMTLLESSVMYGTKKRSRPTNESFRSLSQEYLALPIFSFSSFLGASSSCFWPKL